MGYSLAAFLGLRWITPSLQACGTDLSSSMNCTDPEEQVAVRGKFQDVIRDVVQRTWGEDDLHLKMISLTSLCEMGFSLNGMVVGEGYGSQVGLVYDLGLLSCNSE